MVAAPLPGFFPATTPAPRPRLSRTRPPPRPGVRRPPRQSRSTDPASSWQPSPLAIAVTAREHALNSPARRRRARLRFNDSHSSGRSGAVELPIGLGPSRRVASLQMPHASGPPPRHSIRPERAMSPSSQGSPGRRRKTAASHRPYARPMLSFPICTCRPPSSPGTSTTGATLTVRPPRGCGDGRSARGPNLRLPPGLGPRARCPLGGARRRDSPRRRARGRKAGAAVSAMRLRPASAVTHGSRAGSLRYGGECPTSPVPSVATVRPDAVHTSPLAAGPDDRRGSHRPPLRTGLAVLSPGRECK